MPPRWLLGSDANFAAVRRTAPCGQAYGLANSDSDPKNQLPPKGTAAPAAWQSQFRGPCLKGCSLLQSPFTMVMVP